MAGRLEGKTIVVAGSGGIGAALAGRYVAEGARVVLGDLDADAAHDVARAIDPAGGSIVATRLDGSDADSIRAMIDLALSTYGGLNGFHANFASFADARFDVGVADLPVEVYDEVMHVNARGYLLCTQKAVPVMIAGGGGSIVYTSSAEAVRGAPVRVAYQMSKTAVHALMRHTANCYGRQGIRANVVAPGLVLHPAQLDTIPQDELAALKNGVARASALPGQFGTPEDIAAASTLLLSDEGRYITGQIINVDGGLTMRN